MLFLLEDRYFGNYYGSIEPFIIRIDENTSYLQSNLIGDVENLEKIVIIEGKSEAISVTEHHIKLEDRISGTSYDLLREEINSIVERHGGAMHCGYENGECVQVR